MDIIGVALECRDGAILVSADGICGDCAFDTESCDSVISLCRSTGKVFKKLETSAVWDGKYPVVMRFKPDGVKYSESALWLKTSDSEGIRLDSGHIGIRSIGLFSTSEPHWIYMHDMTMEVRNVC